MSKRWSNNWDDHTPSKRRRRNNGNRGQRFSRRFDELQEGKHLRNQVQNLLSWVHSDPPNNNPYPQPPHFPGASGYSQHYHGKNYSASSRVNYNQGYSQDYPESYSHGYKQDFQQDYGPNYNPDFNKGYAQDFNPSHQRDYNQGYTDFNQSFNPDFRQGFRGDHSKAGTQQGPGPGYMRSWSGEDAPGHKGLLPSPSKGPFFPDRPRKTLRGVRGGKKVKAKRALAEQRKQLLPPNLPSDPEERRTEVLKRIESFAEYIQEAAYDTSLTVITVIEKGLRLSRIGLRVYYDHEFVHKVGKAYIMTGCFSLSEVFLARAVGRDKQKLRQACYAKALRVLREKTIGEIKELKDVGVKVLRADALSFFDPEVTYDDPIAIAENRLEMLENGEITVSAEDLDKLNAISLEDMKMEENMASMMNYIKEKPPAGDSSLVYFLDILAPKFQLAPKCVVKVLKSGADNMGESFACDFFIQDVLIASGSGDKRALAQSEAYEKAFNALTTRTVEEILEESKLEAAEDLLVKRTEVWPKSKLQKNETNISRLKLHRLDPLEIYREWYQVIVVETYNWCTNRMKNAFSILLMTANWNGMLLEWTIEPVKEERNVFKCVMYLQAHKLGEAVSPDKQAVRTLAAADALFKLYETQAVIKVKSSFKSFEISITTAQVEEKAQKLKNESGDTSEDDFIVVIPENYSSKHEENTDDTEEHEEKDEEENISHTEEMNPKSDDDDNDKTDQDNQEKNQDEPESEAGNVPSRFRVNKWHKMVIEQMIEDYAKKDTLQEMRFLSGFTTGDIEQVKIQAAKFGLKVAKDKTKGSVFFKVFRKRMPEEILEVLVRIGVPSGRFTLVPRNELPSHRHIEKVLYQSALTL